MSFGRLRLNLDLSYIISVSFDRLCSVIADIPGSLQYYFSVFGKLCSVIADIPGSLQYYFSVFGKLCSVIVDYSCTCLILL